MTVDTTLLRARMAMIRDNGLIVSVSAAMVELLEWIEANERDFYPTQTEVVNGPPVLTEPSAFDYYYGDPRAHAQRHRMQGNK
jgi:hypothetical protein